MFSLSASLHGLQPQEMEKDHTPDTALTGKKRSHPAKLGFLINNTEHLLYIIPHKKNSKPGLCLQEDYSPAGKDGSIRTCTSMPSRLHTRMDVHAHTCTHLVREYGKP